MALRQAFRRGPFSTKKRLKNENDNSSKYKHNPQNSSDSTETHRRNVDINHRNNDRPSNIEFSSRKKNYRRGETNEDSSDDEGDKYETGGLLDDDDSYIQSLQEAEDKIAEAQRLLFNSISTETETENISSTHEDEKLQTHQPSSARHNKPQMVISNSTDSGTTTTMLADQMHQRNTQRNSNLTRSNDSEERVNNSRIIHSESDTFTIVDQLHQGYPQRSSNLRRKEEVSIPKLKRCPSFETYSNESMSTMTRSVLTGVKIKERQLSEGENFNKSSKLDRNSTDHHFQVRQQGLDPVTDDAKSNETVTAYLQSKKEFNNKGRSRVSCNSSLTSYSLGNSTGDSRRYCVEDTKSIEFEKADDKLLCDTTEYSMGFDTSYHARSHDKSENNGSQRGTDKSQEDVESNGDDDYDVYSIKIKSKNDERNAQNVLNKRIHRVQKQLDREKLESSKKSARIDMLEKDLENQKRDNQLMKDMERIIINAGVAILGRKRMVQIDNETSLDLKEILMGIETAHIQLKENLDSSVEERKRANNELRSQILKISTLEQTAAMEKGKMHSLYDELKSIKRCNEGEIERIKQSHTKEVSKLTNVHNDDLDKLKRSHAMEIKRLKEMYQDEIEVLRQSKKDTDYLMRRDDYMVETKNLNRPYDDYGKQTTEHRHNMNNTRADKNYCEYSHDEDLRDYNIDQKQPSLERRISFGNGYNDDRSIRPVDANSNMHIRKNAENQGDLPIPCEIVEVKKKRKRADVRRNTTSMDLIRNDTAGNNSRDGSYTNLDQMHSSQGGKKPNLTRSNQQSFSEPISSQPNHLNMMPKSSNMKTYEESRYTNSHYNPNQQIRPNNSVSFEEEYSHEYRETPKRKRNHDFAPARENNNAFRQQYFQDALSRNPSMIPKENINPNYDETYMSVPRTVTKSKPPNNLHNSTKEARDNEREMEQNLRALAMKQEYNRRKRLMNATHAEGEESQHPYQRTGQERQGVYEYDPYPMESRHSRSNPRLHDNSMGTANGILMDTLACNQ